MAATIRTYELFDVEWADGGRWAGFETRAQAQQVAGRLPRRGGRVRRRTFEVEVPAGREHLYAPGIA